MTGAVALVPVAELLAAHAGSPADAARLAQDILVHGNVALDGRHDDLSTAIHHALLNTGVIDASGAPQRARAAELVMVCDILATAKPSAPPHADEPRLVLSAPTGAATIDDYHRLDGLVLDVIRLAATSLTIGGAFWNEAGFERLNEVLEPAISQRRIPTSIYVNTPRPEHLPALEQNLDRLRAAGPVTVRWFAGDPPTMLHAKFVIRDRCHGYLGTANLTSWGLSGHIEAGVELTTSQSEHFVRFLEQLDEAGLFDDAPHTHSRLR